MEERIQRRRRRREVVRRRRIGVAAGALLAFVAGVAIGAGGGGSEPESAAPQAPGAAAPADQPQPEREPVDRLSLRQQVGRMVILRFAGTEAPGYVREVLREGTARAEEVTRGVLREVRGAFALDG